MSKPNCIALFASGNGDEAGVFVGPVIVFGNFLRDWHQVGPELTITGYYQDASFVSHGFLRAPNGENENNRQSPADQAVMEYGKSFSMHRSWMPHSHPV